MAALGAVQLDTSKWSGEGGFTQVLIDHLREVETVSFIRVEDAPATRSEADYHFLSNEVFVSFATTARRERTRRCGVFPSVRIITDKLMTMEMLEARLAAIAEVGAPDYSDAVMLQYLRTERVVPPYQTRGYKLVELVRLYEIGIEPAAPA